MAHTYKIKPLQWIEFEYNGGSGFRTNGYDCLVYFDKDGDWSAIFSDYTSHFFDSKEKAMGWIEERHIAKVREYLEALE